MLKYFITKKQYIAPIIKAKKSINNISIATSKLLGF